MSIIMYYYHYPHFTYEKLSTGKINASKIVLAMVESLFESRQINFKTKFLTTTSTTLKDLMGFLLLEITPSFHV